MTSTRTQRILELSSALSPAGAGTLLAMGLGVSDRPIDRVIQRLEAEDGEDWFNTVCRRLSDELGVSIATIRSNSATPLRQLRDHKAAIKRWTQDADGDTRLIGVLGYFLVLSVALHHHGAHISDKDLGDVLAALRAIANALPEPWPGFVEQSSRSAD